MQTNGQHGKCCATSVASVVQIHLIQLMKCSIAAIGDIGKISVTSVTSVVRVHPLQLPCEQYQSGQMSLVVNKVLQCSFVGSNPTYSTIGNIQQIVYLRLKLYELFKNNVTDNINIASFLKQGKRTRKQPKWFSFSPFVRN